MTELPKELLDLPTFVVPDVGSWLLVPPSKFVFRHNHLESLFFRAEQGCQEKATEEKFVHVMQQCVSLDATNNAISVIAPRVLCTLSNMTRLVLSRNKLTSLPELPVSLCFLDVSNNEFVSLGDVSSLVNLRVLRASQNFLKEADASALDLTELDLSYNQLESVAVGGSKMSRLVLNNNKIHQLVVPEENSLQELFVSDNHLKQLPASLRQLVILNAARNMLTRVPDVGDRMAHLDLSSNDIRRVEAALGALPLKTLLLEGNPIRSIRRSLLCGPTADLLEHLRSKMVQVQKENIRELTDMQQRQARHSGELVVTRDLLPSAVWVQMADVLVKLSFSRCKLDSVPESLAALSKLSALDVSENNLSSLQGIPQHLTSIDASCNRLTDVEPLLLCKALRVANLSRNRLNAFSLNSSAWPVIAELQLTSNGICDASFVVRLPASSMELLNLGNNKLAEFPVESIISWNSLHSLDLRCNDLKGLDPRIATLPMLRALLLQGNRMRSMTRYISKGSGEVLEALKRKLVV